MKTVKTPQEPTNLPDPAEPKYSMADVANMLDVDISTVSRLLNKSKLGYYQIGRRKIVGKSHLQRYLSLAQREAKATAIH